MIYHGFRNWRRALKYAAKHKALLLIEQPTGYCWAVSREE